MQNNESSAAKRTIRAEVTLIIVILIVSSWSIYALYRFTYGSESILGSSLSRSSKDHDSQLTNQTTQSYGSSNQHYGNQQYQRIPYNHPTLGYNQHNSISQDDQRQNLRNQQLIQQLLAGQRELYANLNAFKMLDSRSDYPAHRRTNIRRNEPQTTLLHKQTKPTMLMELRSPPSPVSSTDSRIDESKADIEDKSNSVDAKEPSDSDDEDLGEKANNQTEEEPSHSKDETGHEDSSAEQETDNSNSDDNLDETSADQNLVKQDDTIADVKANGAEDEANKGDEETSSSGKDTSHLVDDEIALMSPKERDQRSKIEQAADYEGTVQFDDSPSESLDRADEAPKDRLMKTSNQLNKTREKPLQRAKQSSDDTKQISAENKASSETSRLGGTKISGSDNLKRLIVGSSRKQSAAQSDEQPETSNKSADKTPKRRTKRSADSLIKEVDDLNSFLSRQDFDQFLKRVTLNREDTDDEDPKDNEARKPVNLHPIDGLTKLNDGQNETITAAETSPILRSNDSSIIFASASRQIPTVTLEQDFFGNLSTGPRYLATNDSDLHELLNRRQLLDALKQSQLPPPYSLASGDAVGDEQAQQLEPKTAGSLYHVDHNGGVIMYPSAGHLHQHKSHESASSKKKKKDKKMKEKKKSQMSMKKGGHKKKKHKKEEKKMMKEKKFKAAKKGKKVTKGKGGAGGKKGKKLYKDKGYKKKGFKKVYHKEEYANKKEFFDEFRDKDFKKKWKKFDDKYNYAQMKKYQAKDEKGAKKTKHHGEHYKKYDNGKWKKSSHKHSKEHKEMSKKDKKNKKSHGHG